MLKLDKFVLLKQEAGKIISTYKLYFNNNILSTARPPNLTSLYACRCCIPDKPHKSQENILSASEAIELLLLDAPPRECGLWFDSFVVEDVFCCA